MVAGEPRVRYLHTEPGAASDVIAAWSELLNGRAEVRSRDDAVAAGLFGTVRPDHLPRIGDVVVTCLGDTAVLASAHEPPEVAQLVGFHGAATPGRDGDPADHLSGLTSHLQNTRRIPANRLQDVCPWFSVNIGRIFISRWDATWPLTHSAGKRRRDLLGYRAALTPDEWLRLGSMFAIIVALHVIGWGTLILVVEPAHLSIGDKAFGIGIGLTAYTLGLRHAFDADHIAAIDNTTRKLMNDGQRPLSVGFFFSLGHSSVVFGLSLLIAVGLKAIVGPVEQDSSALHHYTSLIGTSVSGVFLYLIAIINVVILMGILRVFAQMRRGQLRRRRTRSAAEQSRTAQSGARPLHQIG